MTENHTSPLNITFGGGLNEQDRPLVDETLSQVRRRLERIDVEGLSTELSVKERDGSDMRTTLEVWVPGSPRMVATSDERELGDALNDVNSRLLAQLNDLSDRNNPRRGN